MLILLLAGTELTFAKTMYRWVDDKGNVFFSDQVPPDQVKQERQVLDSKAQVIETVDKAKSKEQMEMDKRLAKLRQEQEKIIKKQADNDRVLLSTFRNVNDMKLALDRKMQAFEAQRRILDGNVQRAEAQLQGQQQQAANYERAGKPIPEQLMNEMAVSKKQLAQANAEVQRHLLEKEQARKEFEADMERFKFLTHDKTDVVEQVNELKENVKTGDLLGVFVCQNAQQCDKAWRAATQFVAQNSTTGPNIESAQLIMRAAPVRDSDLSLSVSKLKINDDQQQLFLDIRCHDTSLGRELCASDKARELRPAFIQYIEAALSSAQ